MELGVIRKNRKGPKDIVCRHDADEFTVAMPDLSITDASIFAEGLRQKIADEFQCSLKKVVIKITVSIGVSGKPDDGENLEEVVNAAIQAMKRAKIGGKNRVVVV